MRRLAIVMTLWLLGGCLATPLPHPPTLDPELVTMTTRGDAEQRLEGAEGAVSPPGLSLRVTFVPGPTSVALPTSWELSASAEGAFVVDVTGQRSDFYYFEALTEAEDLFLLALTGGPGESVLLFEDRDDQDDDGSPDLIDCAPADPTLGGQRCE